MVEPPTLRTMVLVLLLTAVGSASNWSDLNRLRPGEAVRVEVAGKSGVDWDQVVCAVHLDAMSSVVDNCNIRVGRQIRKLADRTPQVSNAQIERQSHGVEMRGLEQAGDGNGVVRRIGQAGRVAIGRIADHQRDALIGIAGQDDAKQGHPYRARDD